MISRFDSPEGVLKTMISLSEPEAKARGYWLMTEMSIDALLVTSSEPATDCCHVVLRRAGTSCSPADQIPRIDSWPGIRDARSPSILSPPLFGQHPLFAEKAAGS